MLISEKFENFSKGTFSFGASQFINLLIYQEDQEVPEKYNVHS